MGVDDLPTNPHDALFRAAFADPERAAELLRASLPPEVVAAIDWRSLRRLPESFVDGALRDQQADLVFAVTVHGRQALLYVLFEHKSQPDRWLPLQLLRYLLRLWDAWRQEHPEAALLPPILPYVLYHGDRRWHGPRSLLELVDLPADVHWLRHFQPASGFWLEDLSTYSDADWQQLQLGVASLLTLLHLQQLRQAPLAAPLLLAWRDHFLALIAEDSPASRQLLAQLVHYAAAVADDEPEPLLDAYATIHHDVEEHFMPLADKLIARGIIKGRSEGLLSGRRDALLAFLAARFGELPAALTNHIATADLTELDRLLPLAATVDTPTALLT